MPVKRLQMVYFKYYFKWNKILRCTVCLLIQHAHNDTNENTAPPFTSLWPRPSRHRRFRNQQCVRQPYAPCGLSEKITFMVSCRWPFFLSLFRSSSVILSGSGSWSRNHGGRASFSPAAATRGGPPWRPSPSMSTSIPVAVDLIFPSFLPPWIVTLCRRPVTALPAKDKLTLDQTPILRSVVDLLYNLLYNKSTTDRSDGAYRLYRHLLYGSLGLKHKSRGPHAAHRRHTEAYLRPATTFLR